MEDASSKCWYFCANLHGVISQNTVIFEMELAKPVDIHLVLL
jgi:hypothetical protein